MIPRIEKDKAIFKFLSYIIPTWYFNLRPEIDQGYFPTVGQLRGLSVSVQVDKRYLSQEAQELDLAWNAFQAGVILPDARSGIDVWSPKTLPIEDEYRFLGKNFHPLWSFYVLCLRLISFNNPFRECRAYGLARKVKRVNHAETPMEYPQYTTFVSALVERNPLVSIIIPTLNRYSWLNDVLNDLENQSYSNFEVIVVDQSQPFQENFYKNRKLQMRVWHQEERALWKARNEAIQVAKGGYILLYDDDSRVEPDWIVHHLKTLDFFKADISSGVSISTIGGKVPAHYSYFRWSDQLDTGNVLIKRHVFEQIGLFDRQFEKQRMGDGEFGLRAYLTGFRNISNPYAKRIHLKVGEGGLRQMGSWDGWRPKSWLAPRPVPSVLYFYRKYFGNKQAIISIGNSIVPSLIPYRVKRNSGYIVIALLSTVFLFPLIIFQVIRSWWLSTKMLQTGPLISKL